MKLDDLTIGEAKQLAALSTPGAPHTVVNTHPSLGKYVIARCYAAGVHIGVLKSYDFLTRHATLHEARRIYYWKGAFTLSEISINGVKEGSKLSEEVAEITVSQVEEIIPASKDAEKILRKFAVFKP